MKLRVIIAGDRMDPYILDWRSLRIIYKSADAYGYCLLTEDWKNYLIARYKFLSYDLREDIGYFEEKLGKVILIEGDSVEDLINDIEDIITFREII